MKETVLMNHVNFRQGMLSMFFMAYILLPIRKRRNSGADKRGRFFERGICPAHHGFRLCTSYFILCFMLMIPLLFTGMVPAEVLALSERFIGKWSIGTPIRFAAASMILALAW